MSDPNTTPAAPSNAQNIIRVLGSLATLATPIPVIGSGAATLAVILPIAAKIDAALEPVILGWMDKGPVTMNEVIALEHSAIMQADVYQDTDQAVAELKGKV